MEQKVQYEHFLYGDGEEIALNDVDFCVDRIIMLPKIRPHKLEKAVNLSIDYCQLDYFKQKLLEKTCECYSLIYQLYKRGFFLFPDIKPFLKKEDANFFCYYFRKEVDGLDCFFRSVDNPYGFDKSLLKNANEIDQMIEYGFLPSSIEYCLKYDVVDDLSNFDILEEEVKWSPFEWSINPDCYDYLSFAGYFGSIKCFKHLLMKGLNIYDNVFSMVVCSGCLELFHICQGSSFFDFNGLCKASEYCHLSLLVFMIENGQDIIIKCENKSTPLHLAAANGHYCIVEYLVNQKAEINAKNEYNLIDKKMIPLFIVLLRMATLLLLNILFLIKPK